jgi:hypothetical protein
MTLEINKPNWKLYTGIPILIFICCYAITITTVYKNNSDLLSYGILTDLLFTSPLIYFFIIRKSNISKLTILRVLLLGILVSGFILNSEKLELLGVLKKWVSPLIEIFLFVFIFHKFRLVNSAAKTQNATKVDFLIHCRNLFGILLSNTKAGNVLASEIAIMYYAFFGKLNNQEKNNFTSYKENGILALLYALLMVLIIETITMHFVFALLNSLFAWILTGLSLYTCLQLFAHIRAIKLRPIKIENNILELRMGLAADASISLSNIKSIEVTTTDCLKTNAEHISLFKTFESHNICIELNHPTEIIKIFGIKKHSSTILLFVDNPAEFKNTLTTFMIND